MNVYFISGLGVDERAFQNISLPSDYQVKHINWIDPQKEKDFFKSMNESRNLKFTKWAIDKVLNWSRPGNNFEIVQIHGVNDKLFPIKYLTPDYLITNGTHFMIFNRGEEISEILVKVIRMQ